MNKGLSIFRYLLMITLAGICAYLSSATAKNWFDLVFIIVFFFLFISTTLSDVFKKRCFPTSLTIILIGLMLVMLGIIFRPLFDQWLFVKADIYYDGHVFLEYMKVLFRENFA